MKYFACDIDGTLLVNNNVDSRDLAAIKKFREEGNKFIFSTGRTLDSMVKLIHEYDFEYDYLVLYNGAMILDSNMNRIYSRSLSRDIVRDMAMRYSEWEGLAMMYNDGVKGYVVGDKVQECESMGICNGYVSEIVDKQHLVFCDEKCYITTFAVLDGDIKKAEWLKDVINEEYGNAVVAYRNQHFVDVAPLGCSKGVGLIQLLSGIEGDIANLYAIGDSYNDISMFSVANKSYTFNRAEGGVRESVTNLVDYIFEAIEKI